MTRTQMADVIRDRESDALRDAGAIRESGALWESDALGDPVTIRPAQPADLAALGDFFGGLSLRSRYLRFFAAVSPDQAVLRRMSQHAAGPGAQTVDAVVAVHGGVIVGHAMAVEVPGPRAERTIDIGVVVADRWQGRGVGSALVRELAARALTRGVTSITMDVLHGNHQVLAMITSHWAVGSMHHGPDYVTVRVGLGLGYLAEQGRMSRQQVAARRQVRALVTPCRQPTRLD